MSAPDTELTSAPEKKRDFFGPARRRRVPGKSYTKFVRSMRLMLPLVAAAMVGILMVWPNIESTMESVQQETAAQPTVGRNELINPRFESRDSKNQPFVVTSQRAVQSLRNPDIVDLETPRAEIALKDGTKLSGHAARGAYKQKEDKLLLSGNVQLLHDSGYQLMTEKLLVNLRTHQAWSDQPVSGQGPDGTLQATGLQVHGAKGLLIFTGPVKLTVNRKIEGF